MSSGYILVVDSAAAPQKFSFLLFCLAAEESGETRLFQPIQGNHACRWKVEGFPLDGRLYQTHNGANQGFFSQMMRLPEEDLAIIAVGNVEATPARDDVLAQLFRLCRSLPYQDL